MVEEKDRPSQLGSRKYQEYGKTASLLLRLYESIFSTGKVIILDSGFCALSAIISLRKFSVHSSALIIKDDIGQSILMERHVRCISNQKISAVKTIYQVL